MYKRQGEERDRAFSEHLFSLNDLYHERYGVPLTLSELGVARDQLPAVAKQARYDGAALYNVCLLYTSRCV